MTPSTHIVGTAGPQVSLVTGASRGVGAAIAHRLARDGFAAAVNFAMNATEAVRTVHAIEQEGGRADGTRRELSSYRARLGRVGQGQF